MGNHFHILVKMLPEYKFSDEEIEKRFVEFYGDERVFADGLIPSLREKLSSLSEFMREIKVGFARYYNGDITGADISGGIGLKVSLLIKGETLINCLAYIDLKSLAGRHGGPAGRIPLEFPWIPCTDQQPG